MMRISTFGNMAALVGILFALNSCLLVWGQDTTKPAAKPTSAKMASGADKADEKEEAAEQSVSLFDVYRLAFAKQKTLGTKAPSTDSAEASTGPASFFGLNEFFSESDLNDLKMEYLKRQLPRITMGGGSQFRRHVDAITAIHVYPDNEHVLTSSADKTAMIWKLSDLKPIRSFQDEFNHKEGVTDIATSPNGKYVLTASYDSSIRLWNVQNGKNTKSFLGLRDRVWAVAVSPRGNLVAGASDEGRVMFWDPSTMKRLGAFEGHAGAVYDLNFSNDGRYLITACYDGVARIWDMATFKEVQALSGHMDKIYSAVFSPDNSMVLTASRDKTARLWSTYQGKELCRFVGHTGAVRSALFVAPPTMPASKGSRPSEGGETGQAGAKSLSFLVLTGSDDGTVRAWVPDMTDKNKAKAGQGTDSNDPGAGSAQGTAGANAKLFTNPSDETDEEELDEDGKPKKKKVSADRPPGKNKGIEIGKASIGGTGGRTGVYAMTLAPNGRLLIGGADGIVRIWTLGIQPPAGDKKDKKVK